MMKRCFIWWWLITSLSGCAFFSSPKHGSKAKPLPKASVVAIPGGSGENWRYIGTTDDGAMVVEINNNAIARASDKNSQQVFKFQDRKIVLYPNKYTYPASQPHFKYLINDWLINCTQKQYLIQDATLYDNLGNKISYYDYRDNDAVKWVKLGDGSIADLEYAFICKGQNRNLGY